MRKKYSTHKRFLIFLAGLLLCGVLHAESGLLSDEKDIRIVKTKWFDIIYPQRIEKTAAILYEKADTVYDEVTAQYGLKPDFRIPVVITPAVQDFNAFWSATPYNHIVLYDTSTSGTSDLAVFSETFISTFRHELTHAVTYNMKSKFWKGVSRVFGDAVAPGMLSVTTGMAEGATVASESAFGEGRLNSDYSKHYVRQAIIEGKFPAYHDVSGAADIAPNAAPYYFNGAFHGWLQEKYGLQAYANFWYNVVNGKKITIAGCFKKAYGVKLKAAWNQFKQEYEVTVPDLLANPVEAGLVQDFFVPKKSSYSLMNDSGSQYASLSAAPNRLVWLDSAGGRVYELSNPNPNKKNKAAMRPRKQLRPRTIFSVRGIRNVSLSNDGRILAISYFSENGPGSTAFVRLYDFKSHVFFNVLKAGLKDATVVENRGDYFLIAQGFQTQNFSISISKICFDQNGQFIKRIEPVCNLVQEAEVNPFGFIPLENGFFAYIQKSRLDYSICVRNISGALVREYSLPKQMVVHHLSYDWSKTGRSVEEPGDLFLSYTQKDTMPRLGILNQQTGALNLSNFDISGGVFSPVYWNDEIVYIGKFLRQNRLLKFGQADKVKENLITETTKISGEVDFFVQNETVGQFEEAEAVGEIGIGKIAEIEKAENKNNGEPLISLPSSQYHSLGYLMHGILIPASNFSPDYIGRDATYVPKKTPVYAGVTYITANPWANGKTDLYTFTAGYDIFSGNMGASLLFNRGTASSQFSHQLELKSEFDKNGWKQGGGKYSFTASIFPGNVTILSLGNSFVSLFSNKDYMVQDILSLKVSTIRKSGPGRFEKSGFSVLTGVGGRLDASYVQPDRNYVDGSLFTVDYKMYFPHILPFRSKIGFTYNLPLMANVVLFPTDSIYGYSSVSEEPGRAIFDFNTEAVLFSFDIQKAMPLITAVYYNDFSISAGYAFTATAGNNSKKGFQLVYLSEYLKNLSEGDVSIFDSVYLKATLELTPNIGYFAKSDYKCALSAKVGYNFRSDLPLKMSERLKITYSFAWNN